MPSYLDAFIPVTGPTGPTGPDGPGVEINEDTSFSIGDTAVASGAGSVALGVGSSAESSGGHTVALGGGLADEESACAIGQYAWATGLGAYGANARAFGDRSFAAAQGCAKYNYSSSLGRTGFSSLPSQHIIASGQCSGASTQVGQRSCIVASGHTPGSGANESVELGFHDPNAYTRFQLLDGYAYMVNVRCVAKLLDASIAKMFHKQFLLRQAAGTLTMVGSVVDVVADQGDASAALWTLVPTIGATPTRLVLTFATGAGNTHGCRIAAAVEWVQIGGTDANTYIP